MIRRYESDIKKSIEHTSVLDIIVDSMKSIHHVRDIVDSNTLCIQKNGVPTYYVYLMGIGLESSYCPQIDKPYRCLTIYEQAVYFEDKDKVTPALTYDMSIVSLDLLELNTVLGISASQLYFQHALTIGKLVPSNIYLQNAFYTSGTAEMLKQSCLVRTRQKPLARRIGDTAHIMQHIVALEKSYPNILEYTDKNNFIIQTEEEFKKGTQL